MPDFNKLDTAYRLTPWTLQDHADYVAGRYGSLLQDPKSAEKYLEGYLAAEKRFDESHDFQVKMLSESSKRAGEKPQELVKPTKIDWDPRKRFAAGVLKEEPKTRKAKK